MRRLEELPAAVQRRRDPICHIRILGWAEGESMTKSSVALLWDEPAAKGIGEGSGKGTKRQSSRIAAVPPACGPELYRRLDIRRRRAQIRARRALGLR